MSFYCAVRAVIVEIDDTILTWHHDAVVELPLLVCAATTAFLRNLFDQVSRSSFQMAYPEKIEIHERFGAANDERGAQSRHAAKHIQIDTDMSSLLEDEFET